jgi:ribosomal protein L11 methyltransferase
MDWQQFVMDLDSLDAGDVEDAFLRLGACSVTLSDAGDDPVLEPGPGETPLWLRTRITGLFDADTDLDIFRAALANELGLERLPPHDVETLKDRAWELEWLKDFGPMRFGDRLWIVPSGAAAEAPPTGAAVAGKPPPAVVHLDPGLAFGTGTHPTTALCLEWLDGAALRGKTMLDYGCGSGVLAIAAIKLGAAAATAMDIDPQAVDATRRNAADNGVAERLTVVGSDAQIEGKFDVIVANILAGPLLDFADSITSRLSRGGMLALSGVLCEQAHEVRAAYAPWIEFDKPASREQDGQTWSRLTGKRRD